RTPRTRPRTRPRARPRTRPRTRARARPPRTPPPALRPGPERRGDCPGSCSRGRDPSGGVVTLQSDSTTLCRAATLEGPLPVIAQ
ncbi:hypothetical protein EF905_20420, partial [Streptomyces sp. WAC05374]